MTPNWEFFSLDWSARCELISYLELSSETELHHGEMYYTRELASSLNQNELRGKER